jgi:hypothetical protein
MTKLRAQVTFCARSFLQRGQAVYCGIKCTMARPDARPAANNVTVPNSNRSFQRSILARMAFSSSGELLPINESSARRDPRYPATNETALDTLIYGVLSD